MSRIKRAVQARKHRKHLMKHAKGFKYGRKSKFKLAKEALHHAWTYAYRDRKAKKALIKRPKITKNAKILTRVSGALHYRSQNSGRW